MTFNVRGAYWTHDGVNYWPGRAALNVATIRRHAPDLIGFQEFQDGNMEVYARDLATYRFSLGPHYGNQAPFEHPALAWDPRALDLVESGGFWLSTTPEVHSGAWATDCIRSAQWARMRLPSGATFLVLNTHLDHISAAARLEGARLIAARLAELAGPGERIVVTGDFNCDPGSPPYLALTEAGLADTLLAAGGLAGHTYHGFQGEAYRSPDGRSERIDWVLARGWRAISCEAITDAEPPRFPSDHYPVLAELAEA